MNSDKLPHPTLWNLPSLIELQKNIVQDFSSIQSDAYLKEHPAYRKHQRDIEVLLRSCDHFEPFRAPPPERKSKLRVTAWNVERGTAYEGILKTLKYHPDISKSDIFLLTETDYGMARSGNRYVAKELAQDLNCHGAFVPAYINLEKGNGAEANVSGENTAGLQGHTILSRYPIIETRSVQLPNTKDHLAGKERQIGQETVLVANIETPIGSLLCAPIHLAAHSSRRHRVWQMQHVLNYLETRPGSSIIGGDWNTTTYTAHNAFRAILSFWRRVAMGIENTLKNHYPYPERYFEKPLFDLLKKYDFEFEGFNVEGECTLHYEFNDPFVRQSLEDWLPKWCFNYIDWALKSNQGVCSFKLDWFAGRRLHAAYAKVIQDLPRNQNRFSDHDPILTDISLKNQ